MVGGWLAEARRLGYAIGMLLAMDTATHTASIALYDWQAPDSQAPDSQAPVSLAPVQNATALPALPAGRLLAEWTWLARRRQTQELIGAVQTLLAHMNLAVAHLTALAVTTGPGSFTGVRIAVSAAKGIGLGLSHPVASLGLPTLSVTAAPWLATAASVNAQVWAYLQAGRGRLNWCVFAGQGARWRPGVDDHSAGSVGDLADCLAGVAAPVWLVGEATPELAAAVAHLAHVTVVDAVSGARRAGNLAHLAAQHLHHGHADPLAALQPLYLNTL